MVPNSSHDLKSRQLILYSDHDSNNRAFNDWTQNTDPVFDPTFNGLSPE